MVNAHKLLESGDSKTAQARVPKLELMEDVSEVFAMGGGLELLVGQGINGRAADGALGHTQVGLERSGRRVTPFLDRIGEKFARLNCLGCLGKTLSCEDCWRRCARHIQVDLRWSRGEADALWVLMADRAFSGHRGLSEVPEFLAVHDLETMVNDLRDREQVASQFRRKVGINRR